MTPTAAAMEEARRFVHRMSHMDLEADALALASLIDAAVEREKERICGVLTGYQKVCAAEGFDERANTYAIAVMNLRDGSGPPPSIRDRGGGKVSAIAVLLVEVVDYYCCDNCDPLMREEKRILPVPRLLPVLEFPIPECHCDSVVSEEAMPKPRARVRTERWRLVEATGRPWEEQVGYYRKEPSP